MSQLESRLLPDVDIAAFLVLGLALGAGAVAILWMRDRQTLGRDAARPRPSGMQRSDPRLSSATSSPIAQSQLRDAFSALSRSALKENRDDFLRQRTDRCSSR